MSPVNCQLCNDNQWFINKWQLTSISSWICIFCHLLHFRSPYSFSCFSQTKFKFFFLYKNKSVERISTRNLRYNKKKRRRMHERWCRTDSTIIELNKWLVNTKHRFFSIYFSFKIMCIKKSCSYYCCCCGIVLLFFQIFFLYFQRNKICKKSKK